MITENLSTLQIHKLTQEQYDRENAAGRLDERAIYLTPAEKKDYALKSDLTSKADLVDGKVPAEQLPEVSWENVRDIPFYDTRATSYYSQVENPNPVSFEYTEGQGILYKISDLVLSKDDILNSNIKINNILIEPSNEIFDWETDEWFDFSLMTGEDEGYYFICFNTAGEVDNPYGLENPTFNVPETGIYVYVALGESIPVGLTIEIVGSGEIKQIDKKYLPNYFGETGTKVSYKDIEASNEYVNIGSIRYYKVAEPYMGRIMQFVVGKKDKNNNITRTVFDSILYSSLGSSAAFGDDADLANVVQDNESFLGTTFPKKGIYLSSLVTFEDGEEVWIEFPDYNVEQIDKKFIPSEVGTWENMPDKPFKEESYKIVWDGTPTDVYESFPVGENTAYFYKVSEPMDSLIGGKFYYNEKSESKDMLISQLIFDKPFVRKWIVNILQSNTTISFTDTYGSDVTFKQPGLYFFYMHEDDGDMFTTSFVHKDYKLVQIDEKFIPDVFAKSDDIYNFIADLIPAYTSSDEGKVLKIVDGKPQWVSE